jgi:glutathione S-transferase
LPKLEELYPELPRLGATTPEQKGVERLLSAYITDGGIFQEAARLLPLDLPVFKDPNYFKDRGDFQGKPFTLESLKKIRPDALVETAVAFDLFESTLLADGREWILKTEKPSLADIEGVWALHWVSGMKGALPEDRFSAEKYPRVYAWIKRFQQAVTAAKAKNGKPKTVNGEEAASIIEKSAWNEEEKTVDEGDPVVVAEGLKKGSLVTIFPVDTGRAHKDVGKLLSLDKDEVVIEVETAKGETVRLHAPRHGYKLRRYDADKKGAAKL